MSFDLVDRLWYQAQRDPIAGIGDGGHRDPAGQVRGRRVTDWALRYDLETLKPNKGGLDFDEGAAPLPVSNLSDKLSLTDVGRQVLMSSNILRARLSKEIAHLDKTGKVKGVEDVAALLRLYDRQAGEKFACCHNIETYALGFHVHTADNGDETIAVKHQRERCWLRICPKCARDISARLRLRYAARLAVVELHKPMGFGFKHLVLTMRRGDDGRDLRADLEFIHKAAKKLVHHFWTKGNKRAGAFATVEIGPQGGNVHVHAMVWGAFVPKHEIWAYWEKLTGNLDVHIEAKTKAEVLAEGLKYITKLAKSDDGLAFTLSTEDLVTLHLAMRGKRRVWAWGALYGMVDDERDAEEDVERDAGRCDECRTPMLWARVAELRELLGLSCSIVLKSESKCIGAIIPPATALLPGGPGGACAPPGGA